MGLFTPKSDGDSNNGAPSVAWYFYPFALLWLLLRWFFTWGVRKVYNNRDIDGDDAATLGLFLGTAGAILTGNYVGWIQGAGFLTWASWAVGAGLAIFLEIWPALWLFPGHQISKLVDAVEKRLTNFMRAHFKKVTEVTLSVLQLGSPASKWLWVRAVDKDGKHQKAGWFTALIGGVSWLSIVYFSYSCASQAYSAVHDYGWLGQHWVFGMTLGALAALPVLAVVWRICRLTLEYGELPIVAMVAGAYALYQGGHYVFTGHGRVPVWAEYIVGYELFVAYLFPLTIVVLSGGFWKWLWEKALKPLDEQVYRDKDEEYYKFFRHIFHLFFTAGVAWVVFSICQPVPVYLAVKIAITLVLSYLSFVYGYKLLDHKSSNYVIGAFFIAVAGWKAYAAYEAAGFIYGQYGAITAGVTAAFAMSFIGYPAGYALIRLLCRPTGIYLSGSYMEKAYLAAEARSKKIFEYVRTWNQETYNDKSGYRELFLHVVNVAFAVLLAYGLYAGISWGSGVLPATRLGLLHWIGYPLLIILPPLSYVLGGHYLLIKGKRWEGLEAVSALVGFAAAVVAAIEVFSYSTVDSFKWVSAIATLIIVWSAVSWVVFPAAFHVLRVATGWAFMSWLKPLLENVHAACWKAFSGFWSGVLTAAAKFIAWTAPLRAKIGEALSRIKAAYDDILKRIGGK